MNKGKGLSVPLGISSLITVFLVLCMAVFAMLSLSGARGDLSLSERAAEHTLEYYAASSEAAVILNELEGCGKSAGELEGLIIEGVCISYADGLISYSLPVGDGQGLSVRLRESRDGFDILSWQLVSSAPWQADNSISLIK